MMVVSLDYTSHKNVESSSTVSGSISYINKDACTLFFKNGQYSPAYSKDVLDRVAHLFASNPAQNSKNGGDSLLSIFNQLKNQDKLEVNVV